jgi:dCMP deaminase
MNVIETTWNALSKWDERFMELALYVADWSKDPSTRVGSVIVAPDRRIMSMGYNGFPRGVEDLEERLNDRPTKYAFVAHAERNALDNVDVNVRGCTLFVTLQPCADCTKSIIQKGIKRVVCAVDKTKLEHYTNFVNYSLVMLKEAGVKVIQINNTPLD